MFSVGCGCCLDVRQASYVVEDKDTSHPLLPSSYTPSCKVHGSSMQPHFAHLCLGSGMIFFFWVFFAWSMVMFPSQRVGPQAGYIVRATDTSHPPLPSSHTPSCKVSGSSMQPHFAHLFEGMVMTFLLTSKVLALGP